MRLAVLNVRGSDHVFWRRQASRADAYFREAPRAGSGDGPAVLRQSLQDLERAGEGNHAVDVFNFVAFDLAILRFDIAVWQQIANSSDAGPTMRLAHNFVRGKPVLRGPLRPHASDGGSGIHKHAIKIEQQTATLNFHVLHNTWYSAGRVMDPQRRTSAAGS